MNNNSINTISKNYFNSTKSTHDKIVRRFSMFDGTGTDLTGTTSLDEALNLAALNYSGEKRDIYLEGGEKIKDHYAVCKTDNLETVLGIVGNQYTCVGNKDAFSIAEEVMNQGNFRYEVGGPSLGSKNAVDYSKSFLVLRGDDFEIQDDVFNSFILLNNSFDGSTGVSFKVICQRVVCMNGMVRYLGGEKSQLRINIQHSQTAQDKINTAKGLVISRTQEIEQIKEEAKLFTAQGFTRQQFEAEIIPLVLKQMKLVENDKDRQRGHERVQTVVDQLIQAYNADDTQNYANSAYKVILALSDWESHATPLRNTGNGQIYMNRIAKGMLMTTAVANYIAKTRNLVR